MTRLGRFAAVVAIAAAGVSFAAWSSDPAPSRQQALPEGSDLFIAKGCSSCHNGPDSISVFGAAPSLANAGTWAAERQPPMGAREYIKQSILEPSAFISPVFRPNGPTTAMPTLQLSSAEVEALVDYLLGE